MISNEVTTMHQIVCLDANTQIPKFTCHGCHIDDDPSTTPSQLVHVLDNHVRPPNTATLRQKASMTFAISCISDVE